LGGKSVLPLRQLGRLLVHEKLVLVQFGAHRDLQGSPIGGQIVYFYNVLAGGREYTVAHVSEGAHAAANGERVIYLAVELDRNWTEIFPFRSPTATPITLDSAERRSRASLFRKEFGVCLRGISESFAPRVIRFHKLHAFATTVSRSSTLEKTAFIPRNRASFSARMSRSAVSMKIGNRGTIFLSS
jgi:hypothetical protein